MTKTEERLLYLRASQQDGSYFLCPRCGKNTMKPDLCTNALSRHAKGIYICDRCGTEEALLDYMNNPLPVVFWAVFQPEKAPTRLNSMKSGEAMDLIREKDVPILTEIYERWSREKSGADLEAYRLEALGKCPAISKLWIESFQVMYETADGKILIQFHKNPDGTTGSQGFIVKR